MGDVVSESVEQTESDYADYGEGKEFLPDFCFRFDHSNCRNANRSMRPQLGPNHVR